MENKCLCGCGMIVKEGNKFINGHNHRGKNYEEIYGKERADIEIKKRNNSETLKRRFANGELTPFLKGKKQSIKHRKKIEYLT